MSRDLSALSISTLEKYRSDPFCLLHGLRLLHTLLSCSSDSSSSSSSLPLPAFTALVSDPVLLDALFASGSQELIDLSDAIVFKLAHLETSSETSKEIPITTEG